MADGLKTALELAHDPAAPPAADAEQLELIPVDLVEALGLPEPASPTPGKRGRPAGSRNKRTAAWVEYLEQRYTSPLEKLLQMGNLGIEQLARALDCSRLEAWQEIRQALTAALPYMHQRQPIAVDLTKRSTVRLVINEAPELEGDDGAAMVVEVIEQNQTDSESSPP